MTVRDKEIKLTIVLPRRVMFGPCCCEMTFEYKEVICYLKPLVSSVDELEKTVTVKLHPHQLKFQGVSTRRILLTKTHLR